MDHDAGSGYELRPGRDAATRVKLGSPEGPVLARRRKRLDDSSDEEPLITPKIVRER